MSNVLYVRVEDSEGNESDLYLHPDSSDTLPTESFDIIDSKLFKDEELLVSRTCANPDCRCILEVGIPVSTGEGLMLCHPCGIFTKVYLSSMDRYTFMLKSKRIGQI